MARIARRVAAMALGLAVAAPGARADEPLRFTLLDGGTDGLGPVVLQVPADYAPAQVAAKRTEGQSLSIITLYPSYAPFVTGRLRCGRILCGDEVGATVQLAAVPPPPAGPARREMEAAANTMPGTVVGDAPVPPGFEDAFSVTTAAQPGRAYLHSHLDYLAYRDKEGVRQVGSCGAEGTVRACRFTSWDPATHLAMTYSFPRSALAQRDAIEARLRAMVAGWTVAQP